MTRTKTILMVANMVTLWVGIALIFRGFDIMNQSNYRPPATPPGWILGMMWIGAGASVACIWLVFIVSAHVDQVLSNKPRWTRTRLFSSGLVLFAAALFAIIGTYSTWKHPFLLTPCDCLENEFGPQCAPCQCGAHGVCNEGVFGDGRCACDPGWASATCDVCAPRFRGDDCDTCVLGWQDNLITGERCSQCARGYTGDDCDTCAQGWQPWTHNSTLFPNIVDQDGRHICDECQDNYFGYDCTPCPFGNDVPKVTLLRNAPITNTSRVRDAMGKIGRVFSMKVDGVATWQYDPSALDIESRVAIQIKYDDTNRLSPDIKLRDIDGLQCNNRGTCRDDRWHLENDPDWYKNCTSSGETCSTHADCTVSENCRGRCTADLPIPTAWEDWSSSALPCASDEDCRGPARLNFTRGRCVERQCCEQSRHGDGKCDCGAQYFGNADPTKSPACDFCPGYDWLTGEKSTICMGNGDCQPSFAMNDEYVDMRCACKTTQYSENGIIDDARLVRWYKDFCQCGDMGSDMKCRVCAPGFYGPECVSCPGGPGLARTCGGHGTCDAGVGGTGECSCTVDYNSGAWTLADYQPRYSGDTVYRSANGSSKVCTECVPNFYGANCKPCEPLSIIAANQLEDVFQPPDSFHTNVHNAQYTSLCHTVNEEDPICTLACGGGGWCDWGRKGTGKCKCWSNIPDNRNTWNPLDNVCVVNETHYCSPKDISCILDTPSNEICPALGTHPKGWCENAKTRGRLDYVPCTTDSDCGTNGNCIAFQMANWIPIDAEESTCIEENA